jgi:hypothetical protein
MMTKHGKQILLKPHLIQLENQIPISCYLLPCPLWSTTPSFDQADGQLSILNLHPSPGQQQSSDGA